MREPSEEHIVRLWFILENISHPRDKLLYDLRNLFCFRCLRCNTDRGFLFFLRIGIPWQWTAWRNEAYERLVEEARVAHDQRERMKLYRQADRILVEEAAIVPMSYLRALFLVKPWVSKYPLSAALGACFWKDVIIEPH